MDTQEHALKGRSVFIICLIVTAITALIVFLVGLYYDRPLSTNLYLFGTIVGFLLFIFMTYSLYNGIRLVDNPPKFKEYKLPGVVTQLPGFFAEGIEGIFLGIIFFLLYLFVMLILDAFLGFCLFVAFSGFYSLFFMLSKLVFNNVSLTKGNIGLSIAYACGYTILFAGWIFGLAYIVGI